MYFTNFLKVKCLGAKREEASKWWQCCPWGRFYQQLELGPTADGCSQLWQMLSMPWLQAFGHLALTTRHSESQLPGPALFCLTNFISSPSLLFLCMQQARSARKSKPLGTVLNYQLMGTGVQISPLPHFPWIGWITVRYEFYTISQFPEQNCVPISIRTCLIMYPFLSVMVNFMCRHG